MPGIRTQWKNLPDGDLRLDWTLGGLTRVLRHVIGVPVLAAGLFFAGIVALNLWSLLARAEWDLLPGTVVAALFGALLLPLGWWLTLSHRHFRVDPGGRAVREIVDWRVGRKETAHPVANFTAILLSVVPISESTNQNASRGSGPPTLGLRVALRPRDKVRTPPLELGWFDADEDRAPAARELAVHLSRRLNLPVEDELDAWFHRA